MFSLFFLHLSLKIPKDLLKKTHFSSSFISKKLNPKRPLSLFSVSQLKKPQRFREKNSSISPSFFSLSSPTPFPLFHCGSYHSTMGLWSIDYNFSIKLIKGVFFCKENLNFFIEHDLIKEFSL